MKKEPSSNFLENLTILFIALKLLKVIDWSWWLIFSPFWGALILAIFVAIIAIINSDE